MSKILVVDDEQGIRSVLTDVLEDEGFSVASVATGKAALEALKSEEIYGLLILDVWLPDMSGIEVLEAVSKEQPDLPIVLISGHANIDIAVKSVSLGAYDFLEKPLSIDKIINVVNNAMKISELKNENRTLKEALNQQSEIKQKKKTLSEAVAEFEKNYIFTAIQKEKNRAAVLAFLGVSEEEFLKKVKEHNISL